MVAELSPSVWLRGGSRLPQAACPPCRSGGCGPLLNVNLSVPRHLGRLRLIATVWRGQDLTISFVPGSPGGLDVHASQPCEEESGWGKEGGEPQIWAPPSSALLTCTTKARVMAAEGCVCVCSLGQPSWRTISQFMSKCQKCIPFDSAFLLLGTYVKEMFQPGTKMMVQGCSSPRGL